MEELCAVAAIALATTLAMLVADIAGLLMGLGWRHYSKKLRASRALKEAHDV